MKISVIAIFSMALFFGCGGEPPTGDLEAANKALQDARAVGAEKFASSELNAAQSTYDAAQTELNTQKEKRATDEH